MIYNAARDVVAGDNSLLENSFFSTWGYQIPFVYYEAFILKLFGSEFALKMLNVGNITYFDKSNYILLHILIIIACVLLINQFSQNHRAFICIMLILINYIAYLFIEVQTRYRYFIMPFYFILTAVVFRELVQRGTGSFSEKSSLGSTKIADN